MGYSLDETKSIPGIIKVMCFLVLRHSIPGYRNTRLFVFQKAKIPTEVHYTFLMESNTRSLGLYSKK